MANFIRQFKKYWLTNLITFLVSIAVGIGLFCLVFFTRERSLIAAIDAATFGSLIVLLFGLLDMVAHFGVFDMFAFGFKQLFSMFFGKDPLKQGHYQDYVSDKTEKRNNSSYNFVSIIAAGLLLSISIIVLEIIYHS